MGLLLGGCLKIQPMLGLLGSRRSYKSKTSLRNISEITTKPRIYNIQRNFNFFLTVFKK